MCCCGISEPSQTLIGLNGGARLEINIKPRKTAVFLFCTSSSLTRCLSSRAACGIKHFLCSLKYYFLMLMRDACVCFLFHFSLPPPFFFKWLFAYLRWKSRNDQWVSYCPSLRRDEKGDSPAESLIQKTKEAHPGVWDFPIRLPRCSSKTLWTCQDPERNEIRGAPLRRGMGIVHQKKNSHKLEGESYVFFGGNF